MTSPTEEIDGKEEKETINRKDKKTKTNIDTYIFNMTKHEDKDKKVSNT